jgi:hypothetical protein
MCRKKSCHWTRHRTRQVDHAENGRLWRCDNGRGTYLGYRDTRGSTCVPWEVPSASRTWMRQGVSGVGDEINYFGQSHKFADGNVHIVGAKRWASG